MKTSELIGPALDWAVAKIEFPDPDYDDEWRTANIYFESNEWAFQPSTNWEQGGPIIEREHIELHHDDGIWSAAHPRIRPKSRWWRNGPTPLIAAMRCYVAFKLGDEVEIPEELL
jgi:hypothetical protein